VRHAVRVTREVLAAATAAVVAALCLLLLPAPAHATPTPAPTPSASAGTGETLQGRLVNEGEPLEGVTVTVTTTDGDDVGEAETDDDGAFVVPLPEAGDYTVTLDEDTLPEGVAIREGRSASVTLPVAVGQQRNVLFPLGEGTRNVQTKLDRLPTLAVEGLQFGLIVALAAVGLSLIYGTTGLTNFAHGELITVGALLTYWIYGNGNVPFLLAGLLAVVAAGVLGGAQDRLLWRPLRKRGTGLIAMLVVTIGLALFLRYFFLYLFGGSSQPFRAYESQSPIGFGPIDITPRALISMGLAIVVLLVVAYALLRTRIGKATRAVADNPALASSSGIDVERVIQVVWISGAALAGLAGILLGLAQQVSFQLGFQILLLVFAAVTLGGLGTAFGALVGSLIVGIFTQVSTLFIPSELKNAGALAILILILLVRPQGILGRAERVG
jgi:neutral amino acid transport system permease protein